jgi:prolycopene isomerase
MHYDVIVIGAGIGGLSAAATLARSGLGVRLLERHSQPGGYATTFTRAPFEFEAALHMVVGVGSQKRLSPFGEMLDELGVLERVNFLSIPHLYRAVGPGIDLRLPAEPDAALETLCAAFPEERRGLTRVMRLMHRVADGLRKISGSSRARTKLSILDAVRRFPLVVHASACPLATVIDREVRLPQARLALGQLWGYFGLPPSRLSLAYYAGALSSFLTYGASYPQGKSRALADAFAEASREAGAEVSLGDGAKSILTQGGRVVGVVTDGDERLEARAVVVASNPISAAYELIGRERLPPPFVERLSRARPSMSSFVVHLGLSADRQALGLMDHEVFVNGTVDLEEQYRRCLGLEPPDSFVIAAYNVTDPEFSPPGTSVASLCALVDGRTWAAVPPERYHALKQRFTQHMIERACGIYPAIRDRIETVEASTPLTNMRYSGNVDGAIYGFEMTPEESPAFRLDQRGPLPGLFFAGAWTQPGGGISPCITSGRSAASLVLDELGAKRRGARRPAAARGE